MSPRSWQDRVEDILSRARNIRDYTEGMSFDAFLDDSKTIRAVAFEFTTMGEASRAIRWTFKSSSQRCPGEGCREFAMFWCPSEYFRLEEEILWEANQKDIPPLITALEKIIQTNR